MAYEVIILGHLHMPLYFLGTFTEYPLKARDKQKNKPHDFFDFMRLILCLYANMI